MALRKSKVSASIGPVRALALKHVPALMLLQRHVDLDWDEIEYAAEQVVAGFYYPEEVDQIENKKETEVQDENRSYDVTAKWNATGTESRRRGSEEDEGREVNGSTDGGGLSPL